MLINWFKNTSNQYVEISEDNQLPVKDHSTIIHVGSLNGKVNLSTTPAIFKVGASSLSGRHTLTIYNDSSAIVYVGFNSDVSSDDGLQLSSGNLVTFTFDPEEIVEVYGVLDEGVTSITILELK